MLRIRSRVSAVLAALWLSILLSESVAAGQPLSLEPDIYAPGTVLPTNLGVRLSLGNAADNPLVALTPQGGWGIAPSTGSLIYGWQTLFPGQTISYTDFDYFRNFEAVFDNPTSYVGVDALWPREAVPGVSIGASKGAQLLAYDVAGSLVFSKVLQPGTVGTSDRISVYKTGIKRVIVRPYDPLNGGSSPNYIGVDNFTFAGLGLTKIPVTTAGPLDAPDGIELGAGASLVGSGQVNGSVNNQEGTVAPGESAGELTVIGAFTQGAAGTTILELGTPASDKLIVDGEVSFGGVLDLVELGSFNLADGETLDLITYASLGAGRFDEIRGLAALGNPDVVYGDFALTLVGSPIPLPASIWMMSAALLGFAGRRKRVAAG